MTLADRIRWILAQKKVSQSQLSLEAGLSRQHVNTMLKRLDADPEKDVERETLAALARAGGVSMQWLATGEGSPTASDEAPSPRVPSAPAASLPLSTDPMVTPTYLVDDDHEQILESAFKRGSFSLLSSVVARHMLRNRGFLVKPGADPVHMVAKWMEAATRLQRRGEMVTPDSVIDELTAKIVELERPAIEEYNQGLRDRLEKEHGIKPEMPDILVEARRRAMLEEAETAERLKAEAEVAPPPGGKARAGGAEGHTPKPGSAVRKKEKP